MKKNTINKKGFTLIEIVSVVVIIGIIIVVSGTVVTGYVASSREKTYQSYKADLKGAAENYLIDCMSNNEEGCEIGIPRYGIEEKITYNFLESKGYTEKLKDPEGEGYCDKSYVIARNKSKDGVDVEYQVCLYCKNYKSEEEGCRIEASSDIEAPKCEDTTGESEEWSKENKVITVKCSDNGEGCKKEVYSKSIGEEGKVIEEGSITIEDKAGNKKTCPVKAYVDRKKPTCKLKVEEVKTSKKEGWSHPGVKVTIESKEDEGSGLESYGIGTSLINREYNGKETYTVNNGIVTVFGYVKDKVGNEGYCSAEVKVDATKPEGIIYMGYEIYPKENSTTARNTIKVNDISKYGEIEGVIVYFSEEITTNETSSVYDETGRNIKTSGGITTGKDYGIIRVTRGTYRTLEISVESSSLASKIERIEVIKKENITSVWTNKDVSVYVEGKDTITGVDVYSYDSGVTYTKNNIKRYSSNTTGAIIIKDKVENESQWYYYEINKIDKIAPQMTVTGYKCTDPTNSSTCVSTKKSTSTSSSSTADGTVTIDWTNNGGYFDYDVTESNFEKVDWQYYGTGKTTKEETLKTTLNTVKHTEKNSYVTLTGKGYRVAKLIAVDKAGNSITINVEIKIDRTAPTCSLKVTKGTLGSNDWYISDVEIGFNTHSDTGGSTVHSYGIGDYTTKTATLTTDSTGKKYTGQIKDKAGNTNTCTITVKRDTVKPTCGTISLSGTLGTNDWYTSNVTISKTDGSDATSGHASTTIDKTSITSDTTGTKITLTTTDKAGNTCTTTKTVKKDSTKPTCGTINLSGTKGTNDWYTSNVTISKTDGNDTTSGHASTTIDKTSVTSDTKGEVITLTTTDKAGNTCTTTKTVKKDTIKPTISYNGSCSLGSTQTTLCNSFKFTENASGIDKLYRSHCADTWSSNYNPANYCKWVSAYDRVKYCVDNDKTLIKDGVEDNKTYCPQDYEYETIAMNTEYPLTIGIQYAFKVCDKAGNCSDGIYACAYNPTTKTVSCSTK